MDKRKAMLEAIQTLYIPKGLNETYVTLCGYIAKHDLSEINAEHANKTGVPLLIINVAGKGKWATFKGFDIARADFNHIGGTYAEAYIHYANEQRNEPRRLFVRSNLIAVIN